MNRLLFEELNTDCLKTQDKILNKLEQGRPLFERYSFSKQVHFQLTNDIPVQRWFKYREGYSTELIKTLINELRITRNVLDPFCGCGTTMLASRWFGLQAFGIDINPLSVLVAKTENSRYTKDDLQLINETIKKISFLQERRADKNFLENFDLADKVFATEILNALLLLKESFNFLPNQNVRNFLKLAWLNIIEQVSNIKKEGNGIKYKNRRRTKNGYINIPREEWEKQKFPDNRFDYVKQTFLAHLQLMYNDLKENYGPIDKEPFICEGNCLTLDDLIKDEIQLSVFSPPYCNCFDYFEIHKVELWLGGWINSREEMKQLRTSGLRSNTNANLNQNIKYKNEAIENLIRLFDETRLWSSRIPAVVRGYFDDMHTLLTKIYDLTEHNGFCAIIVGNSAYSGVIIPTDLILAQIAEEIGFKVIGLHIARHLTTSSQQKIELEPIKKYLRESVVLLQK